MVRTHYSAICGLFSLVLAAPSLANWQPGYGAQGFVEGRAQCSIEIDGRLAIGGDFRGAGCVASWCVVFTDLAGFQPTTANYYWALDPVGTRYSRRGVRALANYDGVLIAGGQFNVNGHSPENIALWNGIRWRSLEGSEGPSDLLGGAVEGLAVFEGDLVAVGSFDRDATGQALPGVARWNSGRWQSMGVRPQRSRAIEVYDGELYCGLSKWDGVQWQPLADFTGTPTVIAIDQVDDGLAFGGFFETIGGADVKSAAILRGDGSFGQFGAPIELTIFIAPIGPETEVQAASSFASYAGETYTLATTGTDADGFFGLSILAEDAWNPVNTVEWPNFWSEPGGNLAVFDRQLIALTGSRVLADVPGGGGLDAFRYDGQSWNPLVPSLGSAVVPRAIALVNGRNWFAPHERGVLHETDFGVLRALTRPEFSIQSMGATATGVFVAGEQFVGIDAPFLESTLLEFELSADGSIVNAPWVGYPFGWTGFRDTDDGELTATVPYGESYLSAAYDRESAGGVWRTRLVMPPFLSPGFEHATLPGLDPIDGIIDALVIHQGQPWYAVAGQVFRVDGSVDDTMSATLVGTFNAPVRALVSDHERLVAGGDFESVNAVEAPRLASFQAGSWHALPTVDGVVNALATDGEFIIVGGEFESIGGTPSRNVALLSGTLVGAFPDGPNGPVTSVAAEPDHILLAGDFTEAGGQCAVGLAEWIAPLATVSIDQPQDDDVVPEPSFRLLRPMPNPFNARVSISFEMERAGSVMLRVLNASGRVVRTLVAEQMSSGLQHVVWDGKDTDGVRVASGVYFAALEVEGRRVHRKMALVQ